MYCALPSLPQKYELAQPDAVPSMDSVLSVVILMLEELIERQDAPQSAAAAANTGTDILHQWTEADFNSLAAAVGSKSCFAAAVLAAAGAQRGQLATTKDEIIALTQRVDELSSAVCTFVLDLGKTLGVEVGLRLHCLTGDASMCTQRTPLTLVTTFKLLLYLYSHVQKLVQPHDTPLNKDTFLEASGVLKEAAVKLAAAETTLASTRIELGQRDAANAVLTTANIKFKKQAAATAEAAAMLCNKLRSVHAMLKEALPHEVSNYLIQCWCMLATITTIQCIRLTVLTLLSSALLTSHCTDLHCYLCNSFDVPESWRWRDRG
jgi:hypothetical protein